MANKYSRSNTSDKAKEQKTMQQYENQRRRLNKGAKIMSIIIIITMVVFYVLSAGLMLFD